jgi:mRNA-degrading endonuclease RelE of RelBE toxin-antitoxin system
LAEEYRIEFADEAATDVRALRAFEKQKILAEIDSLLCSEPKKTSRTRIKLMVQPFWSQYRLRVEDFRAYYDVDDANRLVTILRVLKKTTGQTPSSPP